jgi:hypothetical protein
MSIESEIPLPTIIRPTRSDCRSGESREAFVARQAGRCRKERYNLATQPFLEQTMTRRSPATISAVLTVLILVLLAILFLLLQMIALNGAGETQGLTAMGISLGCQSLVIILLATLAARATTFLITRVAWNSILAVVVTVIVAGILGGVISFLASIIAIPVAGIG